MLDYLAIDSRFRGQGIGSYFTKYLCNYAFNCLHQSYLLMEVENPWQGSRILNQEKRWNFYKNLGAKELKNVKYLLPPLGGIGPTEMSLMIFSQSSQDTLQGSLVKKLIQQIYKELHNRENDDLMLNSLIDQIGELVILQ